MVNAPIGKSGLAYRSRSNGRIEWQGQNEVNLWRFSFVTLEKRMGGNTLFWGRIQLFCNKKQILTCTSHELQLFDTSVMIKGRADD